MKLSKINTKRKNSKQKRYKKTLLEVSRLTSMKSLGSY